MLIQRLRDGRFAQRNVAFPVTLSLADSTGRH
jgi:hypothetical protein